MESVKKNVPSLVLTPPIPTAAAADTGAPGTSLGSRFFVVVSLDNAAVGEAS